MIHQRRGEERVRVSDSKETVLKIHRIKHCIQFTKNEIRIEIKNNN